MIWNRVAEPQAKWGELFTMHIRTVTQLKPFSTIKHFFMRVISLHAPRSRKVVQCLKKVKCTVHNTRAFICKVCIN